VRRDPARRAELTRLPRFDPGCARVEHEHRAFPDHFTALARDDDRRFLIDSHGHEIRMFQQQADQAAVPLAPEKVLVDDGIGPKAQACAVLVAPVVMLSRSGDDALLRLVRQPDEGDAATPGGWRRRGRGARRDH